MAGLMKLKCLVFACMIVAGPITAKAALSCGEVNRNLKPCTHYLTSGGRLGPVCCNGVRNLNGMARTPFDRRQACRCIKSAARSLGPGLNRGLAAGIPSKCGIRIPYNIQVRFSTNCNTTQDDIGWGTRVERLIAWQPPQDGWVKLNTDGASRGNPGDAAAGGVLRDKSGHWLGGFALNIGVCSAPLAELWGVYYGLYIAWGQGIRRLEVEVDSEIVVGFLNRGISDSHPLSFLARLCYSFISKDWIVRVSHVYREANRLADGLANYAFSLPLGFHMLESRPDSVVSILLDDVRGIAFPREVCL